MSKDQSYHESCVKYNEGLAEAAEALAPLIEHPDPKKWCIGVGKQHRFHANRHKAALQKIIARGGGTENVELIADGLDVPEPTDEEESAEILADEDTMAAIAEAEAELPDLGPEVIVVEEPDLSPSVEEDDGIATVDPAVSNVNTFEDGCISVHKPLENANCTYAPKGA